MLLAGIVFIPLLVLHAIYAAGERHHLLVEAGYRARALVLMAAQQEAEASRDAHALATRLATLPQIVAADPAACQSALDMLARTNPRVVAASVLKADGSALCASADPAAIAPAPPVRVRTMSEASLVEGGGIAVDPVTRQATISLEEPIAGPGPGSPRGGSLVLQVDAGAVWSSLVRAAEADGMDIMLLDLVGPDSNLPIVIASSQQGELGRPFPGNLPFAAAARSGEALRVPGFDGTDHVLAAALLPGARQQILLADIPTVDLLSNMRRRFLVTLVGVSVVGALVLCLAWFMARWSFLRPLAALVDAAKQLRAGDLKVRVTSRELWAPEFSELAVALNVAAMRLERNHRTLSNRANRDGLTGLASRRRFDEQLTLEWRRARRAQTHISVLMIDVDEFKGYNDRYGHPMGDECLRQISASLLRCLRRPSDMAARYGGEEFVILLPETDRAGAAFMASRFLAAIRELGIVHRARPDGLMSVSIGVASVIPGDDEEPVSCLVQTADEALYAAKRQGRARAVLADPVVSA